MRHIRCIIIMLFVVGGGAVFGQSQPTKASIMEDAFGAIRAEMVRDACDILEYNDQALLGKITNQSIIAFDNELETRLTADPDNLTIRYLRFIIKDANDSAGGYLGGDDLNIYQTRINKFRTGLKQAYEKSNRLGDLFGDDQEKLKSKKETIGNNDSKYLSKITDLFNECRTYNELQADGKLDEYKGNVFRPLIESKSGVTTPTQPKPKQENKPKPVEKSEEQIAFEGCNNWSSIESFMSTDPSSTYINDVDKKGWNICESKNYDISDLNKYLSVFGDNAEHKNEAQDMINQNNQQVALGKCNKWVDYEKVLERWKDDPSFIDKVYEKCWEYCEGRDKLDDYKKYLALLDNYGGTLHYQDAEEAINRLSTTPQKDYGYLWYLLAALAVVALLLVILRKRKKNQSQPVSDDKELREENAAFERCSTISACDYYLNTYPNGRFVKEVIAKKEGLLDKIKKEEDDAFKACTTVTACDYYLIKYPKGRYVNEVKEKKIKLAEGNNPKPKPKPENKPKPEPKQKQGEWVVVGASVKGNGHIQSNMPCQDNHKFELLGKGWGVAIVSDGAGSAAYSETGSKVVVERGMEYFKNLIEKEGWREKNSLPSDAEWLQKSYFVLKAIRNDVEKFSKYKGIELKSLSATCLAVVFTPLGLLAVHVGDGRMGCKTASGEWKAIMTPHKGEEANQTLFLVSDFWDIPNYVQSGVLVPESIVVREPVEAFAMMSDGCESTAWLCTAQNAETGKYYDQNKPFEGFFNPVEETLASFHKDNVPEKERQEKWYRFIESGTKGFVKEQDDKTMILGVFL